MAALNVLCSGGFRAALVALAPTFATASNLTVAMHWGSSVAGTPTSIPARLERGEPADVVIGSSPSLVGLLEAGLLLPGHTRALARSGIGIAVRAGACKPDVGTVEALTRTLLACRSIAISTSASGIYLGKLFAALAIDGALGAKLIRAEATPVAEIVASGAAEIGLQQVSELLPVAGIDLVGPLPAAVQEMTLFSAGVAAGSQAVPAALRLIDFLAGPAAFASIEQAGMVPAAKDRAR
ncbi:MAG TPA: substrate-binding domain-containing protein [Hyphomicrobiaceae bacterium]|jgi:molybdate transport system substrate-binding protein|nr:substrate-binding domain-containing protein [Hyphomicrobiaceae bacterium]